MDRQRKTAWVPGVGRATCLGTQCRSRAVIGWSLAYFAAAHGPNPAVNTDAPRRDFARLSRAGYLTR